MRVRFWQLLMWGSLFAALALMLVDSHSLATTSIALFGLAVVVGLAIYWRRREGPPGAAIPMEVRWFMVVAAVFFATGVLTGDRSIERAIDAFLAVALLAGAIGTEKASVQDESARSNTATSGTPGRFDPTTRAGFRRRHRLIQGILGGLIVVALVIWLITKSPAALVFAFVVPIWFVAFEVMTALILRRGMAKYQLFATDERRRE